MIEFDELADLLGDAPGGWADRAACKGEDPNLFFPVSDLGPGARETAQAKAVCARCPVRAECLGYALDRVIVEGIFGGTTGDEREKMIRRPRRSRPFAIPPGRPWHKERAQA